MQSIKNKLLAISIALLLTTSMTSFVMIAGAHSPPWQIPTYMYVSVSPNPIGVGQTANVNLWLNSPPPTATAPYHGDLWQNMTVIVTYPDGTSKNLGTFTSDQSGGAVTRFTPTTTGNYTFQSFFGGQTIAGNNPIAGAAPNVAVGDYYQPSQSKIFTLIVQQDPIEYPSTNPLPTDYWTRPIYAENNNWNVISGNWLGAGLYNATGNYNPYTTAPTTAHILWTKPEAFGGMIGGEYGSSETSNYYATAQYEVKFTPVILNGILYYTQYPGSTTFPTGTIAVDLRTGQTLWTSTTPLTLPNSLNVDGTATAGAPTVLRMGQILNFISPNQYGGEAYLWSTGTPANVKSIGTTYNMFDAMTGTYILSVVNATTFSALTSDDNGNLIGYYVNSSTANTYKAPTLNAWNSTKAIMTYAFSTGQLTESSSTSNSYSWRPPQGSVVPFSYGIQWSAPLETNSSGNPITLGYSETCSGVILMTQYGSLATVTGSAFQAGWIIEAGYSTTDGKLLWGPVNRTEAVGTRVSYGATGNGNAGSAFGNGVWVECDLNTMQINGYNLLTGKQLWGPKDLPNPNQYTSLGLQEIVANDSIYIWTYGGDAYSFNLFTGALNWQYHSPSGGIDSPYGVEPLWTSNGRGVVAGGELILSEGHEFSPPLFHGANQIAFNTTTGEIVWEINAFTVNGIKAVSDGILVTLNAYDNQIYAFGMGPTKVTVNAPVVGVTTKTSITITGTVTDISAGSQQQAIAANYPNGLPAVSDASMTPWMEHVYMQQPMPTNITGVPVNIMVVDSNGNFRSIGTTTSNADGAFSLQWTPDITGKYTVYAEFAGSQSYYPSRAVTAFSVDEIAPTAAPTEVPIQSAADMYFVPAIAGLFILMIVIGIVLSLLMIRKRP